jgi:hypothetical protein
VCGRVIQSSGTLHYAFLEGMNATAVSTIILHGGMVQNLLAIRRNRRKGEGFLDPLRWGLIPHWCQDQSGGRRPINAKCKTVRTLPTCVPAAAVRCVLGRVLQGEAALCHSYEARQAVRHWRHRGRASQGSAVSFLYLHR